MLDFKPPSQARTEKTPRHHSDLPCTGVKRRANVHKTNLFTTFTRHSTNKSGRGRRRGRGEEDKKNIKTKGMGRIPVCFFLGQVLSRKEL